MHKLLNRCNILKLNNRAKFLHNRHNKIILLSIELVQNKLKLYFDYLLTINSLCNELITIFGISLNADIKL